MPLSFFRGGGQAFYHSFLDIEGGSDYKKITLKASKLLDVEPNQSRDFELESDNFIMCPTKINLSLLNIGRCVIRSVSEEKIQNYL